MDRLVDLDQVAALMTRHISSWEESGLVVGALTWRDEAAPWPSRLREDRRLVADPDSVGVAVRKDGQQGQLVIFRGGWADLEYWSGDASHQPVFEAPGWNDWLDLPATDLLLRRFAALFDEEQNRTVALSRMCYQPEDGHGHLGPPPGPLAAFSRHRDQRRQIHSADPEGRAASRLGHRDLHDG
jgi:hypothetical protein